MFPPEMITSLGGRGARRSASGDDADVAGPKPAVGSAAAVASVLKEPSMTLLPRSAICPVVCRQPERPEPSSVITRGVNGSCSTPGGLSARLRVGVEPVPTRAPVAQHGGPVGLGKP